MAFPQMPPVRFIRQLSMFRPGVPHAVRFWSVVGFALCYQLVGGVYLTLLGPMTGANDLLPEEVMLAAYCALIGLNIVFPILFRVKFRLYTRQLWFLTTGVIIGCSLLSYYTESAPLLWGLCLLTGAFKMIGMFGCISTVQLNFTPTRNFAVFLPIIYVLVCGGVKLSGIAAAWLAEYAHWRLVYPCVVGLMLAIDAVVYFLMQPDHRSGPYLPLKGIDWRGMLLWTATCVAGGWCFTFGEHFDWFAGREIRIGFAIFLLLLGVTLRDAARNPEAFLPIAAFRYRATAVTALLLSGMTLIQAGAHTFQPIFVQQVLGYDNFRQIDLDWPELAGVVMGAIFVYAARVRLGWSLKWLFFCTFLFVTAYAFSFCCLIGPDTEWLLLVVPLFAYGMAEVMMETLATYYLSQRIPFPHFFMNITIIGFVRCGVGTAAAGAWAHRQWRGEMAEQVQYAFSALDGLGAGAEALPQAEGQALIWALRTGYGYLVLIGVVMMIFVLTARLRTSLTRLLPTMAAVRRRLGRGFQSRPAS